MTQGELASGLCTSSMISQIESGKARPSFHMLSEIAKRLEVNVDYFFEEGGVSEDSLLYQFAKLHMRTGDHHKAIGLLQAQLNSRTRKDETAPLLLDLIDCYLQVGRTIDAKKLLSYMEADAEDDELRAQIAVTWGTIWFKSKRFMKAITLWEKALSIFSELSEFDLYFYKNLLLRIADAYVTVRDEEKALAYYEQALSSTQRERTLFDQATTCLQLAKELHQKQNYPKAIQYAERSRHLHDLHRQEVEAERNRLERGLIKLRSHPCSVIELFLKKSLRRFERLESPETGFTALKLARHSLQDHDEPSAEAAYLIAEHWTPTDHPLREDLEIIRGLLDSKHNTQQGEQRINDLAIAQLSQNQFFKWEDIVSNLAWVRADQEDFKTAYTMLMQVRTFKLEQLKAKGVQLGTPWVGEAHHQILRG